MDNTVDSAIQNNQLPANHQDAGNEKVAEIKSESPRVSITSPAMSPKPTPEFGTRMSLYDGLKRVYQGEHITRAGWEVKGYYVLLAEERVKLYAPDGKLHDWIISAEDLEAEDWVSLY